MSIEASLSWKEAVARLSLDSRWKFARTFLNNGEESDGISIQRLWRILDSGWEETLSKMPDKNVNSELLESYYAHPVWLINAAFSDSDLQTVSDRAAAVRLIMHVNPKRVLDFGGGFGVAARLCGNTIESVENVDLIDVGPFADLKSAYLFDAPKVRILNAPENSYDAVICTEVLEHVIDPISLVCKINSLMRIGGAFATSYSFAPGIKCHLPENFHLAKLMLWVIRALGFGFYGFERRGSTVYSFIKHSEVSDKMISKARMLANLGYLPIPFEKIFLLLKGL